MITAPLPLASPSGTGQLSMIIPRYYGLTITYSTPTNQFDWSVSRAYVINIYIYIYIYIYVIKKNCN